MSKMLTKMNTDFIVDIRDYHFLVNTNRVKKVLQKSKMIVISSEGFKQWLPSTQKIILNHNISFNKINELLDSKKEIINTNKIVISYIGHIRDYNVNKKFVLGTNKISSLKLNFSW